MESTVDTTLVSSLDRPDSWHEAPRLSVRGNTPLEGTRPIAPSIPCGEPQSAGACVALFSTAYTVLVIVVWVASGDALHLLGVCGRVAAFRRRRPPDNSAIGPFAPVTRALGGARKMAIRASQITNPAAGRPPQHAICMAQGVHRICVHPQIAQYQIMLPASRASQTCRAPGLGAWCLVTGKDSWPTRTMPGHRHSETISTPYRDIASPRGELDGGGLLLLRYPMISRI